MSRERNAIVDIVKSIGIVLIVAGHCGFPFTKFIYLFHVSVFFIASGFCFNNKKIEDLYSLRLYFLRKIKSLWIPYFMWTMIFSIMHNFFVDINIYIQIILCFWRI